MKKVIPKENIDRAIVELLSQVLARQDALEDFILSLSGQPEQVKDEMKKNLSASWKSRQEEILDYLWIHLGNDLSNELLGDNEKN